MSSLIYFCVFYGAFVKLLWMCYVAVFVTTAKFYWQLLNEAISTVLLIVLLSLIKYGTQHKIVIRKGEIIPLRATTNSTAGHLN